MTDEPITLDPDYETMAIQLQDRCEGLEGVIGDRNNQIYDLEDEITKLKGVIEYLEKKLGINNPI